MKAEISYDLIMQEVMEFVEGTYRLPGCDWEVFILSRGDATELMVTRSRWDSGAIGIVVKLPRQQLLSKEIVEKLLGELLGVTEWVESRGPDSMQLR